MLDPENIDELQVQKKELIFLQEQALFDSDELKALSLSHQISELNKRLQKAIEIKLNS